MINKMIYRIMTFSLLLSLIVILFGIDSVVSAQQEQTSYVVQRGDTLRLIALRYGITWQDIAIVNNLPNPNRIYPGQVLVIPRSPVPVEPVMSYGMAIPFGSLHCAMGLHGRHSLLPIISPTQT